MRVNKYTVEETSFYGLAPAKVDLKQGVALSLELVGGIVFWAFVIKSCAGENAEIFVAACTVLWLIYMVNKLS